MPTPKTCPQCSAPLEAKTLGKFQDKFMVCLYCNFKVDIPDEFEVRRAAESKSRDGTKRRVEVSYRRRDLTPGDREPERKDKLDKILDHLKERGIAADNEVFTVGRRKASSKGEILDAKTFTEVAEKYHGPEFAELARQVDFDMYPAKEGVEHEFEKSETVERTAMFITSTEDSDKINSSTINSNTIILYLSGTIGFIAFIFWLLS